ncbi:DUF4287 domain-containing protein [Streptomyces canus]|uniref:DUF4287 domain-containing protein n=1 Tax=Streptomyces canus TaxID=58343 RepID=UPI000361A113|nr:DUF4287 domain-containing protein [Streptomyces canus]
MVHVTPGRRSVSGRSAVAIEKKYGRPIAEWQELVRSSPPTRHMELVIWLKTEHGPGQGHANAVVAHTLAEAKGE